MQGFAFVSFCSLAAMEQCMATTGHVIDNKGVDLRRAASGREENEEGLRAKEYNPEAALPLDVDRTLARQINSFAVLHAGARHPGSYYCSPCETRANLRLERRPQPYGFSVTS